MCQSCLTDYDLEHVNHFSQHLKTLQRPLKMLLYDTHHHRKPSSSESPHFQNALFGNQHALLLPHEQRVLVSQKLKLFVFQGFSLLSWFCMLKVVWGLEQSEMICVKKRITRIICHFWFMFEFEKWCQEVIQGTMQSVVMMSETIMLTFWKFHSGSVLTACSKDRNVEPPQWGGLGKH